MQDLRFADRLSSLDEMNAHFRRIYELSRSVDDPINLVVGQPDFVVPRPLRDAACAAIQAGRNSYAPTQGLVPLREQIHAAVAQRYPQAFGRDVLLTGGTMAALNLALLATINPGDEVILFDPAFMAYEPMVRASPSTPCLKRGRSIFPNPFVPTSGSAIGCWMNCRPTTPVLSRAGPFTSSCPRRGVRERSL